MKPGNPFSPGRHGGAIALAFLCLSPWWLKAQSNIVYNGSFEIYPPLGAGWMPGPGFGGGVNDWAAYHGGNYVNFATNIWQDLPTVVGRRYNLWFAMAGMWGQPTRVNTLRVWWEGAETGLFSYTNNTMYWRTTNFVVTATAPPSRLLFENVSGIAAHTSLDAIKVTWLDEPPSLCAPVVSRSAIEGALVNFQVKVGGTPPFQYQWHFEGQAIPGATNYTVALTNVGPEQAGHYLVTITNHAGWTSSQPAVLVVNPPPKTPVLVLQPKSQAVAGGYAVRLLAAAMGRTPLSYQWYRNSNALASATNAGLTLAAVAAGDAGSYTVLVSNQWGTVLSVAATVSVTNLTGGGLLRFGNYDPVHNLDAPVYDVDGVTRLEGTNFMAQLYVGIGSNNLHAVGAAQPFQTGTMAGYIVAANRTIPDVRGGQKAYVQVRAWERAAGESYEEVRALGGKAGASDVVYNTMGMMITNINGLKSFNLESGSPLFAAAKLDVSRHLPGGITEYLLTGETNSIYLVEHLTPPNRWQPWLVLTNVSGIVPFVDPEQGQSSVRFFRARLWE